MKGKLVAEITKDDVLMFDAGTVVLHQSKWEELQQHIEKLEARLDAVLDLCVGANCDIGPYIHRDRIQAIVQEKQ